MHMCDIHMCDTHMCDIHMCDMTTSYLWHDSFVRVFEFIHTCDTTPSCLWHDSFELASCLMWHRTHSRQFRLPAKIFFCSRKNPVTCDIVHTYDSFVYMSHSYVWLVIYSYVWLGMYSYVWHTYQWLIRMYASFVCVISYTCVTWPLHICDMTHLYLC